MSRADFWWYSSMVLSEDHHDYIQDVTFYGGGHDCAEHINNGSTNTGACVHDIVVNQLLSKIDGVNLLNKVLVIGMTSRYMMHYCVQV